MFLFKKNEKELNAKIKKEVTQQINKVFKDKMNYTYSNSILYSKAETKNQDEYKKRISELENQVKELKLVVDFLTEEYKNNRDKNYIQSKCVPESKRTVSEKHYSKNESIKDKFNRLINNSTLSDEFKSINLSYVNNKLIVTNEGEPLYYIVKNSDSDFDLYPNKRFRDKRALVKAQEVFDFDIQGESEIEVIKPCELVALYDGYGIKRKGKVCIS